MSNPTPSEQQKTLHQFRVDYVAGRLDESDVAADPVEQFSIWFDAAKKAAVREPNAITLATADVGGVPSARIVLLKDFDARGFTFFGNYESRKGRELEVNPAAALVFFWELMERQVRVEGAVVKVTREESKAYFDIRPRAARVGAWASAQSRVIASRAELEERNRQFDAKFGDIVPLPDHWGGWRLHPRVIEFWQGGAGRLHDRLRYTKRDEAWTIERLSP